MKVHLLFQHQFMKIELFLATCMAVSELQVLQAYLYDNSVGARSLYDVYATHNARVQAWRPPYIACCSVFFLIYLHQNLHLIKSPFFFQCLNVNFCEKRKNIAGFDWNIVSCRLLSVTFPFRSVEPVFTMCSVPDDKSIVLHRSSSQLQCAPIATVTTPRPLRHILRDNMQMRLGHSAIRGSDCCLITAFLSLLLRSAKLSGRPKMERNRVRTTVHYTSISFSLQRPGALSDGRQVE